jgi:hypothetical protein
LALVAFSRDASDISSARGYAQRLRQLAPSDRSLATMIEELERTGSSEKR